VASILDFFSAEAGQNRTKALRRKTGGLIGKLSGAANSLLGPTGIPGKVSSAGQIASMINPVAGMERSMRAAGNNKFGESLIEIGGVVLPAGIVAKYGAKTALAAAKGLQESLTATGSALSGASVRSYDEFIKRMNEPLQTKLPSTMYSNPFFDVSKINKELLDPLGYQKTKMKKYLSDVKIGSKDLNNKLPRTPVTIESLEGKRVLPLFGDKSSGGLLIKSIDGQKFDKPVLTEGGVDYMRGQANQLDNSIWASAAAIANRIKKEAQLIAEKTGDEVVGSTISMAPNAVDFTNFAAETMAEMMKFAPVTKANALQFDDLMLKTDPNWPGVQSKGLREYVKKASSNIRKSFIRNMDSRPAQDAGFPSPAEIRLAVTDPSQIDLKPGMTGLGMSKINTSKMLGNNKPPDSVPHTTYDTSVKGAADSNSGYVGSMPPIHQSLLFPDFYKGRANSTILNKKTGVRTPESEAHKTYAMKTQMPSQLITPEIVDTIMKMQGRR